jgi:hypothetical protein
MIQDTRQDKSYRERISHFSYRNEVLKIGEVIEFNYKGTTLHGKVYEIGQGANVKVGNKKYFIIQDGRKWRAVNEI